MKYLAILLLTACSLLAQGTLTLQYDYTEREENGLRFAYAGHLAELEAFNANPENTPVPIPGLVAYSRTVAETAIQQRFHTFVGRAEADAQQKLATRQKYAQLLLLLRDATDAERDAILDAAIAAAP